MLGRRAHDARGGCAAFGHLPCSAHRAGLGLRSRRVGSRGTSRPAARRLRVGPRAACRRRYGARPREAPGPRWFCAVARSVAARPRGAVRRGRAGGPRRHSRRSGRALAPPCVHVPVPPRRGRLPRVGKAAVRLGHAGRARRRPERIGLFTVARPDGLQRLVVDPRPSNAAWGDPPPVRLTLGRYWRASCNEGGGRRRPRGQRGKETH